MTKPDDMARQAGVSSLISNCCGETERKETIATTITLLQVRGVVALESRFVDPVTGLLFDHPPPWEFSKVTVCIAAACQTDSGDNAIVLCTDWKTGSALGSAETALKQRALGKGWHCLLSGYESDMISLYNHVKNHVSKADTIDETNITGIIRDAIFDRKKEKIAEYLGGKYAISYSDFLQIGKERLPNEAFRDTMQEIAAISLKAEFVIAGFDGPFPILCQTTESGTVSIRDDFAIAGEGGFLATAALLQREQIGVKSVTETLYNVYEAKKFAQRVPSVGDATTLGILTSAGRKHVSQEGRRWLRKLYAEYGPKQFDQKLVFPSGYLLE
jgi:hypothetical protein